MTENRPCRNRDIAQVWDAYPCPRNSNGRRNGINTKNGVRDHNRGSGRWNKDAATVKEQYDVETINE